jgi:ACT domain-containing protein
LQELELTTDDDDIVHVDGVKEERALVDEHKVKAKVEAIRKILSREDISEMREGVEAKALSRIRYYKMKDERTHKKQS